MLEFEFMRRTLLAGAALAIALPLIGIVMVNRRTSMVGDALSHVSLAGVAAGLIVGIDPIIGAVVSCVVAALLIEEVRAKMPQLGDMAVAVTMSAGLGLAVILADLAPGGNSFESYLFGSISAVTTADLLASVSASALVIIVSAICYGSLMNIAVDTALARIAGVRIRAVNAVFTVLTALVVGLACKVVGALLVVSLIVLPVACALVFCRSYKACCIAAPVLGLIYTMAGLTFSYHLDVRPGGSIVMAAVLGILIAWILRAIRGRASQAAPQAEREPVSQAERTA
ncbi:metal ABC transporter permease [Collinsella sp. AGMB00827]|uniref:Metal ABC transporter permease n=1 Tax=Collinsella ureilytica TaxID=2869515 RepID=A0ABS7MIV1_9ACTN|nr:metal ABC transporter permease [Collinsella urealyticum]MBY4797291.1 metal ABC transporter permease [Collinsella urealyticum]